MAYYSCNKMLGLPAFIRFYPSIFTSDLHYKFLPYKILEAQASSFDRSYL